MAMNSTLFVAPRSTLQVHCCESCATNIGHNGVGSKSTERCSVKSDGQACLCTNESTRGFNPQGRLPGMMRLPPMRRILHALVDLSLRCCARHKPLCEDLDHRRLGIGEAARGGADGAKTAAQAGPRRGAAGNFRPPCIVWLIKARAPATASPPSSRLCTIFSLSPMLVLPHCRSPRSGAKILCLTVSVLESVPMCALFLC